MIANPSKVQQSAKALKKQVIRHNWATWHYPRQKDLF